MFEKNPNLYNAVLIFWNFQKNQETNSPNPI